MLYKKEVPTNGFYYLFDKFDARRFDRNLLFNRNFIVNQNKCIQTFSGIFGY